MADTRGRQRGHGRVDRPLCSPQPPRRGDHQGGRESCRYIGWQCASARCACRAVEQTWRSRSRHLPQRHACHRCCASYANSAHKRTCSRTLPSGTASPTTNGAHFASKFRETLPGPVCLSGIIAHFADATPAKPISAAAAAAGIPAAVWAASASGPTAASKWLRTIPTALWARRPACAIWTWPSIAGGIPTTAAATVADGDARRDAATNATGTEWHARRSLPSRSGATSATRCAPGRPSFLSSTCNGLLEWTRPTTLIAKPVLHSTKACDGQRVAKVSPCMPTESSLGTRAASDVSCPTRDRRPTLFIAFSSCPLTVAAYNLITTSILAHVGASLFLPLPSDPLRPARPALPSHIPAVSLGINGLCTTIDCVMVC